jgi:DNA-binding HxlR family transcriptional regulator
MMEQFPLPEPEHEVKMAHWLLGRDSDLDLRVLETLLGQPKRYRDLRDDLLEGPSDTPLTRALRRLGERGLVRKGMNLDDPDDPRYYAATTLGVLVALKAHELRPITETLEEAKRAGLLAG